MVRFYYHEWTDTEDRTLADIMTSAERKKVLERFNEAAEKLQRTAKSCQNRWYEIRHKFESRAV
jgi:hypothetical protein